MMSDEAVFRVVLPELGEGVDAAEVACANKEEGDAVQPDDEIMEVVTDKATFAIPADAAGRVSKIHFKRGDTVKVGDCLAEIERE